MPKRRLNYVCQLSKQHYPVGWCANMFQSRMIEKVLQMNYFVISSMLFRSMTAGMPPLAQILGLYTMHS